MNNNILFNATAPLPPPSGSRNVTELPRKSQSIGCPNTALPMKPDKTPSGYGANQASSDTDHNNCPTWGRVSGQSNPPPVSELLWPHTPPGTKPSGITSEASKGDAQLPRYLRRRRKWSIERAVPAVPSKDKALSNIRTTEATPPQPPSVNPVPPPGVRKNDDRLSQQAMPEKGGGWTDPNVKQIPVLRANLIDQIVTPENVELAFKRNLLGDGAYRQAFPTISKRRRQLLGKLTRAMGGGRKAKGVDHKSVLDAYREYRKDPDLFISRLKSAMFVADPVRRVDIPKPSGGTRPLGIPTARDRVIQTMILQVLQPLIDPFFGSFSHGFRPERSVYSAAAEIKRHLRKCKRAIDFDISKFFDTVDHTILMDMLKQIGLDRQLLRLIEAFLQAEIVHPDGKIEKPYQGTPQGGVISPLLANIYLHALDMELARRGLRVVRYADDFVIFTSSRRAAGRILNSISLFLTEKLKLQVNREKTKIVPAVELEFLGLGFKDGIQLSAKKLDEFKGTFRRMTRKVSLQSNPWDVQRLKRWLGGWFAHFGRIESKVQMTNVNQWVKELIRQRGQITPELNVLLNHLWDLNVCKHENWKAAVHAEPACERSERQGG